MLMFFVERLMNMRCCCEQEIAAYRTVLYPNHYSEAPGSEFHGCHARAGLYHTFTRGNRRFRLKFLPLCASSSGAPGGKVRHADRVPGQVQPSARTAID